MAPTIGAPTCHRLHHLLHRPPPPSSSLSLFLKPILISTATTTTTTTTSTTPFTHLHIPRRALISPSLPSLHSRPRLFCYSPTLPHSHSPPEASLEEEEQLQQLEIPEEEEEEEDTDNGEGTEIEIELESKEDAQVGSDSSSLKKNSVKPPSLTVKEKKELASYAHSLGKKLKSQLVGKSGVTPSVAASFVENLESNELLKVKIHGTCPGELEDAVAQLEEATGSVIVGQIGRTVILYKPSITKLKAEEKKQQLRKVFTRRKHYSRPASMEFQKSEARPRTYGRDRPTSMEFQKNGDRPRAYGRDRRGRSRV